MQKIMFNDAYGLTQATIERWKTNTRRAEFNEAEQGLLTEADEVYIDGDDDGVWTVKRRRKWETIK